MREKETNELKIRDLSYLEEIISQRQDDFMHRHVGMGIERGSSVIFTSSVMLYRSSKICFVKG